MRKRKENANKDRCISDSNVVDDGDLVTVRITLVIIIGNYGRVNDNNRSRSNYGNNCGSDIT